MQRIELNQLPNYSDWPSRLLGLEEFSQRVKTKEEIDREYEHDKWGALLAQIQKNPGMWNLAEVDNYFLQGSQGVISIHGDLYVSSLLDAHRYFVDEIERRLSEFLPNRVLVELGAGYGSVILNLAKRDSFRSSSIVAAEYTQSGIACINHLSAAEKIDLTSGKCDFSLPSACELAIPRQSLIYTCMAVTLVPMLQDFFVDDLMKLNPAVVVHFEPCLEHYDNSLLGMLRQKYIRLNDYNRNLIFLLKRRESLGHIRILKQEPCIFGENCFLPCSFIAWSPVT